MKNSILLILLVLSITSCVKQDTELPGHEQSLESYSSLTVTSMTILAYEGPDNEKKYVIRDSNDLVYHTSESDWVSNNNLPKILSLNSFSTSNIDLPRNKFTSQVKIQLRKSNLPYDVYSTLYFIPQDYLGQSSFQLSNDTLTANLAIEWH